jgi:hypothetical protein
MTTAQSVAEESGSVPGIQLEELRVTASVRGAAARLVLAGTADTRAAEALGEMLKKLHTRCTEAGVLEVEVDLRDLEFMNSSSFKAFVSWITAVRELDRGKQYKLTFQSDNGKHWQRRSLGALSCFAIDLITIRT